MLFGAVKPHYLDTWILGGCARAVPALAVFIHMSDLVCGIGGRHTTGNVDFFLLEPCVQEDPRGVLLTYPVIVV